MLLARRHRPMALADRRAAGPQGDIYGGNIHQKWNDKERPRSPRWPNIPARSSFWRTIRRSRGLKRCAASKRAGARGPLRKMFRAAAGAAAEVGRTRLLHLCTTLTISPHKDVNLINEIGARTASDPAASCAVEGLAEKQRLQAAPVEISKALASTGKTTAAVFFPERRVIIIR